MVGSFFIATVGEGARMKVKFIIGTDYADLQNQLNDFLSTIGNTPVSVKYELDNIIAVVEFDEPNAECRCCDCQHYDTGGDVRGAWGLCQRKGIRTRFSSLKCEYFTDIRV